jgi:hypothetical protein
VAKHAGRTPELLQQGEPGSVEAGLLAQLSGARRGEGFAVLDDAGREFETLLADHRAVLVDHDDAVVGARDDDDGVGEFRPVVVLLAPVGLDDAVVAAVVPAGLVLRPALADGPLVDGFPGPWRLVRRRVVARRLVGHTRCRTATR